MSETLEPMANEVDQKQLAEQLLAQAKEQGVDLIGPNGLLNQLTKNVLETALDAEMTEHLGYDKHDPAGRGSGNSRNGMRSKTVLTEIGPVEIEVPREVVSRAGRNTSLDSGGVLRLSRRVKKGPGRRPQSAKRRRFMELRARGWSVVAAAREVGVSRTAGNNWSRRHKTYRGGKAVGFVPALDR